MLAGRYDLTIEQGATFTLSMYYQDDAGAAVDLTGYSARMHLRKADHVGNIEIELTTENGRIVIDGARGQIVLNIAAVDTQDLTASGVYDLEVVLGAVVHRIMQGAYTISPEVTR